MSYSEIHELIEEHGNKGALDILLDNFYNSKNALEAAEDEFNRAKTNAIQDTASLKHLLLKLSRENKGERIQDGYVISHTRQLRTFVIKIENDNLSIANWPIIQD